MDIKEQIRYVNEELKKGLSITKIEKNLKLGKDTLRKRLNKQGYNYDKMQKQFIESAINKNIDKDIKQQESIKINIDKMSNLECFTQEEIEILKQIAKDKSVINSNELKKLMSEDYKTTTLEIEINLGKMLEKYCYENKLTKKTVINQALLTYLV
ncbi:hypothetical protein [uncultured Clostridium sp.]|uniref:hypothetical protein n=1 Tax=uncultured Clostridium sp. TaxID=59620 RepID=UPI002638424C|nr:hypothetical protein [uncultured Clostridium sp.]